MTLSYKFFLAFALFILYTSRHVYMNGLQYFHENENRSADVFAQSQIQLDVFRFRRNTVCSSNYTIDMFM